MGKTKKYSRIPTKVELESFTGMHCSELYSEAVTNSWRCPSCNGTAQQLVRWTDIRGLCWRDKYADEHGMGFTIAMAKHHCHAGRRFATTLMCGDCNSADGAAKRKLGLPSSWSFSPAEIAQFVTVEIHSGATKIDYDKAMQIYKETESCRGLFWGAD